MDITKLFNGIAVIIDDEINKSGTPISTIRGIIESKNIPVVAYDDIPQIDIIPALTDSSFVILDWDYTKNAIETEGAERVIVADTLAETQEDVLINFISKLLEIVFVPVFIFTFKSPESVKEKLREKLLWQDAKPNRIFIKQKNEVSTEAELFSAIEDWMKEMPSAYVLKEWERVVAETKNNMFLELYNYSPNWTKIIWDLLKEDTKENQKEFGDFVTKNLINRINGFTFEEAVIESHATISNEELRRVVEGERYLSYNAQPGQAYTGDLFKDGRKYYLNIRAQCDLSRADANGDYNPILYCIEGEKLRDRDIATDDIRLTSENELVFGADKRFSLDKLREICNDETKLPDFNNNFVKYRNKIFFRKGAFLERNDKVIVGCIAGEQAIQFNLDLIPKTYSEIVGNRIGRILPPYITRIQQKCAQNMVREGVMPIPKELFNYFEG